MGKTVTTYLIDGDPSGTRFVFIENDVCRMYVIPRTKLEILNEEKLLQGPSLYILLGDSNDASGFYNDSGFTVRKGSILVASSVPSFGWPGKREKMLSEYGKKLPDGRYELQSDYTFSSPSTAADFCIGSSNNGWLVWKDKQGFTLDSIIRK